MNKSSIRIKIPHEEYARRLIIGRVGYAETISKKDCFELMLEFGELEKRMCDHWRQIAEDYAATKPPSFIVQIRELGSDLCEDCARPKNDLNFHFDAMGAHHASGLHWFKSKAGASHE